jgi:hypothetical protein
VPFHYFTNLLFFLFFNSTIIKEYFNDIYLRFTSYVYRNSINYRVWLDANLKISNSKIKYFFESNPWVTDYIYILVLKLNPANLGLEPSRVKKNMEKNLV